MHPLSKAKLYLTCLLGILWQHSVRPAIPIGISLYVTSRAGVQALCLKKAFWRRSYTVLDRGYPGAFRSSLPACTVASLNPYSPGWPLSLLGRRSLCPTMDLRPLLNPYARRHDRQRRPHPNQLPHALPASTPRMSSRLHAR